MVLRRRSSSDLAKQKFGTMPLVPLHGDSTDATMLSANQTLVKPLHPSWSLYPSQDPVPAPGLERPVHPWVLCVCAMLVSVPVSALCACRLLHPLPLPGLPMALLVLSVLTPVRLLCF